VRFLTILYNLADLKINMVNRKVDDKNVIVAQPDEGMFNK
jgi:hypothetical protein